MENEKFYGIILDTETANTLVDEDGKLNMMSVLPYDFGFAVIDNFGSIYETHSYVNSDIFLDEFMLMRSAYYAEKIPQYIKELADGSRKLKNTYEIRKILCDLCKKYDCKFIMAHNARFDYRACNNIQRWTTKSKYRYFFPREVEIWDTLKMARDVLAENDDYINFCVDNGYMTKHKTPRPQLTAEVIYRYITNDLDFIEEHTGLEDVLIENEIYKFCITQNVPMRKKLFENA